MPFPFQRFWLEKQAESNPSLAASMKKEGEIRLEKHPRLPKFQFKLLLSALSAARELHLLPNPAWSQLANPNFLLHGQVPGLKIFPEISLAAPGKAGTAAGRGLGRS